MKNIQLFFGDCFTLLKDIPDHSIDLVLTDPPYLFNRHGGINAGTDTLNSIGGRSELYKFGNKMMGEMADFGEDKICQLLDESERVLKIMRGYYFCNETALQYYMSWATSHNYKYNVIVLEKPAFIMNRNKYATNCEYLIRIVAKSGAGIKILDYNYPANKMSWLYSVQPMNVPENKFHPTEKPQDIINGVIQLNTNEDDVVLDPFMGSGTVGVVCKNTKRKYSGMEIDEKYYKIAAERIENSVAPFKLF
ncbi:MAG: hypothetical protein J5725_12540 [Bacteroidales bacterium]|nr:hypothetical protein [Bacteroidales bacterium]